MKYDTMRELFNQHSEGLSIPFICETFQCNTRKCYDIIAILRKRNWPIRMINGRYKLIGNIPELQRKNPNQKKMSQKSGNRKKDIALSLLQSSGNNGIKIKSMGKLLCSSSNSARSVITNLRKDFRIDSLGGYYVYKGLRETFGDSIISSKPESKPPAPKPESKPPAPKPESKPPAPKPESPGIVLVLDDETNKLIKDLPQDLQRFFIHTMQNIEKCNEIIEIYSDLHKIRKEISWNGQNE